jgi:hypothetical protein
MQRFSQRTLMQWRNFTAYPITRYNSIRTAARVSSCDVENDVLH